MKTNTTSIKTALERSISLVDPSGNSEVKEYVRKTAPDGHWVLEYVGSYNLDEKIQMEAEGCTLANVIKSLKRNPGADPSVFAGVPAPGQLVYGDDMYIPNSYADMCKLSRRLADMQEKVLEKMKAAEPAPEPVPEPAAEPADDQKGANQ